MRLSFSYIRQYVPWFLTIILVEGFSALLLWLADIRLFQSVFLLLFLFSIFSFSILGFLFYRWEKKREDALIDFLSKPGVETEVKLQYTWSSSKKEMVDALLCFVYGREAEIERTKLLLSDYETYVETWAHEVKLPLSLLTLILDNKKRALEPELAFKLDYIRNQVQTQIAQILFYYRIRSEKNDFYLEEFRIDEAMSEVLEDYSPLLREKDFRLSIGDMDAGLYTDRRSFDFIMGQVISNAIKYSDGERTIDISLSKSDDKTILTVRDGGMGVKACDLAHIFDKGFTGDTGDRRKKSTGMGLYLVKELADALHIDLEVDTEWGCGFSISFIFRKIEADADSKRSDTAFN